MGAHLKQTMKIWSLRAKLANHFKMSILKPLLVHYSKAHPYNRFCAITFYHSAVKLRSCAAFVHERTVYIAGPLLLDLSMILYVFTLQLPFSKVVSLPAPSISVLLLYIQKNVFQQIII